jgi:hypothetical protein
MTLAEIKSFVKRDLQSKGLSNPQTLLSSLNNVEQYLLKLSPDINSNPKRIAETNKKELITKLEKIKYNKLTGSELSVLNNIYEICKIL